MQREELIKLIEDIESNDLLVRNFSSNILLGIRDVKTTNELYSIVRSSGKQAKAIFLKLACSQRKAENKKHILQLIEEKDDFISAEASAAAKKLSFLFTRDDLLSMLASRTAASVVTALEIATNGPFDELKNEIINSHIAYRPQPKNIKIFNEALKFVVKKAAGDKNAELQLQDALEAAVKNKDAEFVESCLKYAHLLIAEPALLEIIKKSLNINERLKEAMIKSALNLNSPASYDFIEQFITCGGLEIKLRQKVFVKFIKSKKKEHTLKAVKLLATELPVSLKYCALSEIQNISTPVISEAVGAVLKESKSEPAIFECLLLSGLLCTANAENHERITKIYHSSASAEVKAAALEMICRADYSRFIKPDFIRGLIADFELTRFAEIRCMIIASVVKYAESAYLETFYNKCIKFTADFTFFCEAYIKRLAAKGRTQENFYGDMIKRIIDAGDPELIVAAAVCVPTEGGADFLHDFIAVLDSARAPLFTATLKNSIASALLKNSSILEIFMKSARKAHLGAYLNVLGMMPSYNSLKAIIENFFTVNGGFVKGIDDNTVLLLKDAFYNILINDPQNLFKMTGLEVFKTGEFIDFISPVALNVIEDLCEYAEIEFSIAETLTKKTPESILLYKALAKNLGNENKFFLYNLLQKAGGAPALDIINELS